jgi:hypothetical protein
VSTKIKVINPVWNGDGRLKRKVAEHYVSEGRAEWVGDDLLRLDLSHPQNQAAADRASAWARAQGKVRSVGGPVDAIFQHQKKTVPHWARIAGIEKCVFQREPNLIYQPGKRPLREYSGKHYPDDGPEKRIIKIFAGRGKHPRLGVKARFLPELSNALLCDAPRDKAGSTI